MKKDRMKKILLIAAGVLILILGVEAVLLMQRKNGKKPEEQAEAVVKENVSVLEDKETEKLLKVEADRLLFEEDPGYEKGEVLVSGESEAAEDGFLRKVTGTEEKDGAYVVKTEPAYLTDVFEKAHVRRSFRITEDGVEEIVREEGQGETARAGEREEKAVQAEPVSQRVGEKQSREVTFLTAGSGESSEEKKEPEKEEQGEENEEPEDYDIAFSFEAEAEKTVELKGSVGLDLGLDVEFDIEDGEIQFEMALHDKLGGEISLDCQASAEASIEKGVFEKNFRNLTFHVAGIPIVLTNRLEGQAEAEAGIEGNLAVSFGVYEENKLGFSYDSRDGKVKEINEHDPISDGLDWRTEAGIKGEAKAGVSLHFVSKLYGCTGGDISFGVYGKAGGEAKVSVREDLAGYAGYMELAVSPEVAGSLVVEVPVIDERLAEQELFQAGLPNFWEKRWESSKDWKGDLEAEESGKPITGTIYKTRYGEVNMVTCPQFQFLCPEGWTITTEEVAKGAVSPVEEHVELANDRGVTVSYWQCGGNLGAASRTMVQATASKAADSSFVPGFADGTDTDYSSLGNFVVARVEVTDWLDMNTDTEFSPMDQKSTYFAVIPESRLGEWEYAGQARDVDQCMFHYASHYAFIAHAPEGQFTEQEEREVIEILKSFQLAE